MGIVDYLTPTRFIPFMTGILMTINFVVFWALPVAGMGQIYRNALVHVLKPMYDALERNSLMRSFAATFIYNNPQHADFFPLSLLLVINCSFTIPYMFYHQLKYGSLPWWLIYAYYCSWVGFGGSIMGAAYALAHKEVYKI